MDEGRAPLRRFVWCPYLHLSLCLLLAAPLFFLRGFGILDDSLHLKFGELIVAGALPYQDFFENKPPGVYYIAALIAWLGQGHWLAPRVFLFLFAGLYGAIVVAFSQRRLGDRAALLTAWLFPLSYVLAQGYSLYTDPFCGFCGFLAAVSVAGPRGELLRTWLAAGLLVGLAFLFKQPAIFFVAAFLSSQFVLAASRRLSIRLLLTRSALFAAGFVAMLGLAALAAYRMGVLADAWDALIVDGGRHGMIALMPRLALLVWLQIPAVSLTIVSLAVLVFSRRARAECLQDPSYADLLLWANAGVWSLLATLPIPGPQGHYAAPAVWGLTLANVAVWSRPPLYSEDDSPRRWWAIVRPVAFAVLLLPYAGAVLWGEWIIAREDRLRLDLAQWYELRRVLQERLPENCPVLCLSSNPGPRLYYMSGRRPAVRYLYYWWNTEHRFSRADAWDLIANGHVPAAIVEMPLEPAATPTPGVVTENDLDSLSSVYELIRLDSGRHPLYGTETVVLIRRDVSGAGLNEVETCAPALRTTLSSSP